MAVQRQQSEMIMNLVSQLSRVTQSLAQLQKGVSENLGKEEDNSVEYSSNCTEHQSMWRTQAEASIIEQCTASLASTEKKGMPASQEMGNFFQTLMSSRLDNKKRESLSEKHLIPENTRLLDVPKVHEEIWRVLSLDARSKDAKLQKIQSNCLRTIVPVVRAINHLVKNQSQTDQVYVESIVTLLVDSLALFSCASSDMNSWRSDSMKELNHEYTALCSQQNPVTEHLFGDNIMEQLKTITETNKIGLKVRPLKQFSQHRFNPMTKHSQRPFLLNRPPPQNQHLKNRGREVRPLNNNRTANRSFTRKRHQ